MVSAEELKRRLEEKRRKGAVEPSTPPREGAEEPIKYCPNCNREYGPDANFCEECGTKLEEKRLEEEKPAAHSKYEDVIVVSSNHVPGYRAVETLGFVYGLTVRSRGIGGQVGAGLRSLVGGEIKEYVTMMEHARQEAIDRMIEHAKELGANAIISARFDSDSISNVMQEILAYGTAVIIEKE
ncbi:MAG: heavy metal-binding domain-containing protein [Methanobacteriales archaeon]|nr:heavy metal-binding domain-containing protein [Methanobacteriales archaeon]